MAFGCLNFGFLTLVRALMHLLLQAATRMKVVRLTTADACAYGAACEVDSLSFLRTWNGFVDLNFDALFRQDQTFFSFQCIT